MIRMWKKRSFHQAYAASRRAAIPILCSAPRNILLLLSLITFSSSAATTGTADCPASKITSRSFGLHLSAPTHQPWPTVPFGTIRTWDQWPSVTWSSVNPAPGVYQWSRLDNFVTEVAARDVDIIYTFGVTPRWASVNPSGTGCAYGDGTCYPPRVDAWAEFLSAITARYRGKIKYWELWNEPNVPAFWAGGTAKLVELAAAAYPIVRAGGGTVLSPSPQGANGHKWLDAYFTAGGSAYVDIVAFHGYIHGPPEKIVGIIGDIRRVAAGNHGLASKPIWDTEHSWGNSGWPFGAEPAQQAAWLSRFILLSFANGVERSVWYMWDGYDGKDQWGMLFNADKQQLQEPGMAYRQVYDWLVHAAVGPCRETGAIYACHISRVDGYQGLAIWAVTADPRHFVPFTRPKSYTQYRTLDSEVPVIFRDGDDVVTLSMKPLLLEKAGGRGKNASRAQL